MSGRPPAEYLPADIYADAAAQGMSPKAYSSALFDQSNRIYSMFRGTHNKIKPFFALADLGGVSMDTFVELIETAGMRKYLDDLISKPRRVNGVIEPPLGNLNQICKRIGASRTWIGSLYEDKCELKALKDFVEGARTLGWSMDKMRRNCGL